MFFVTVFFLLSCSPSIDDLDKKADKLIEQKKYSEAIKVYDRIIKKNPGLQDAYYNKGYCFLQDSNYAKALVFFNHVLKMKGISEGNNIYIEWNVNSPFASEEDKHQIPADELFFQIGITKYYMDSLGPSYRKFQACIDQGYETAECTLWQGLIWLRADSTGKACNFFERGKLLGSPHADELITEYCKK